jgi:Holliday junction resolvase RusA-like endonuclease
MRKSIPLQPVAAARPRVTRHATYYPKTYEAFRVAFKALVGKQTKLDGPLSAYIEFHFAMPQSWTKKKKLEMDGQYHTQVPDTDNLEKAVLDGLNGNVYDDDSQVCQIFAVKRWAKVGQINIKIEKIE